MFGRACVASPHRLASEAGLEVLAGGGNAMDAAIAINLTLGVVAPYSCGFGGDLFAMVWRGGLHCYEASGAAPHEATVERVRALAGAREMPATGPLPVTVPGAVEGWFTLLDRFGTRSFGALAAPAERYARDGFVLTPGGEAAIRAAATTYAHEREWQRVYGGARAGEALRQPDLARTIARLAADGPDAYYRGDIARAIVAEVRGRGGLLAEQDLARHAGRWVDPLRLRYRDVEIVEMPPPTQGIAALEALALLGEEPLPPPDTAERHHLLIEAIKIALSDLDAHVTDPRSMRIPPRALLAAEAIAERRARIDATRAGTPRPWGAREGGTAYMCAADADGMCVSLIQSNWMGFGSGITVPGWGINLHNRGNHFSLDDAHVNVIAPGKKTLHTIIPAMALREDGSPRLVFGTMGGYGQAQTHVQLVTRIVDDGRAPQDAIDGARWYVSPHTWAVAVEDGIGVDVVDGLRARGHDVRVVGARSSQMGHAHAILLTPDGYLAGSDPRAEGAALGM